jgi:uncharacterized membrane protein YhaH (DUF805 family)
MDFDLNKAVQYFQTVVTQHYTDFRGRVSRRDFWTTSWSTSHSRSSLRSSKRWSASVFSHWLQLALFLPTAGMIARRLQDTGRNGSLVWLLMVPVLVMSTISLLAALAFGGVTLLLIYFFLLTVLSLISVCAAIYLIYVCIQPGRVGTK